MLDEYIKQQEFRNWSEIISRIPVTGKDRALDLGCGTGFVTGLLAKRFTQAIGIESNETLLDWARAKYPHCSFINADIEQYDYDRLGRADLMFMGFVLAYVRSPVEFLTRLKKYLTENGRIVVIEVDRMFSRHLPKDDPFYERVVGFEEASENSRQYNFVCGSRLPDYFRDAGLSTDVYDSNLLDQELNFVGACSPDVLTSWKTRLSRMVGLRQYLGDTEYQSFSDHFLDVIASSGHECEGSVRMMISGPRGAAER
jgi:SAM-dependent methyltransferase